MGEKTEVCVAEKERERGGGVETQRRGW